MIRLITEWVDGTLWELDVDQDQVIALTMSFLDLTDIEKQKGDYTKSFALPRSQRNDWFFGQFGDPAAIGYYWNTHEEAPVWLLDNSNLIIEGSLRMEHSDPSHNRYNISISGKVFTIKEAIGDALMSDLDMTAWAFTPAQIATTWTRAIFGGHMVFGIHDFGFGYGLYKKAGVANSLFDISIAGSPIILNQCIPSFRLNELIRMIFNAKGLTVQGSWFSEPETEEIYVQANNPLSSFISAVALVQCSLQSYQQITGPGQFTVKMAASPSDPSWSNTLWEYTAPATGTYYWDAVITPSPGIPVGNIMLLWWQVNAVNSGAPNVGAWNTQLTVNNRAVALTAGDTFRIQLAAATPYSSAGDLYTWNTNTLKLASVTLTGASTNPAEYWSNHKQIDFLRGFLETLNLIIWQDLENKINIDTWDYYMTTYGTKKDWSDKVDKNAKPITRPINGVLRNPINLELKSSEDILNSEYEDVAGRAYGSYREDTRIPFTQDAKGQMSLFSPAPVQSIISSVPSADYPDLLILKMYESEDNIEYKPPGLQLLYFNELKNAGKTYYTADALGGGTTARTTYPYFSNFRLYSASSWMVLATTLDLNFTYWTPPSPSIVTAPSEEGLYNRYFAEMLRERYDLANKILELNIVLEAHDIETFSFADTILVNLAGTPVGLRILQIRDYVVGKKRSVKVRAMITFIR